MKKILFLSFALALALALLAPAGLFADVGEGELARFKSAFTSKIISDNPGREAEVRSCLASIVKQGNSGTRLIDRFGLFLYDSARNGLELERIRFFRYGATAAFFIILKDSSDGRLYSLYLEYVFTGAGAVRLDSTYFSMVYSEKIKSVTSFFGGE